jgi:hypothetical protein
VGDVDEGVGLAAGGGARVFAPSSSFMSNKCTNAHPCVVDLPVTLPPGPDPDSAYPRPGPRPTKHRIWVDPNAPLSGLTAAALLESRQSGPSSAPAADGHGIDFAGVGRLVHERAADTEPALRLGDAEKKFLAALDCHVEDLGVRVQRRNAIDVGLSAGSSPREARARTRACRYALGAPLRVVRTGTHP